MFGAAARNARRTIADGLLVASGSGQHRVSLTRWLALVKVEADTQTNHIYEILSA
jgi:hypothetical protein